MSKPRPRSPLCIVIAGPNGAGKTTFAREFLSKDTRVVRFVNADLIASGLSPLRPELAALAAGRLFLKELDRLARARLDFAFESTVSGLTYLGRLNRWKAAGYRIEIVYLRLRSSRLALRRIAARVKQGGHTVPRTDVLRRFDRSWINPSTRAPALAGGSCSGFRPTAVPKGATGLPVGLHFQKSYRLLADTWSVYDNSGKTPQLTEQGP